MSTNYVMPSVTDYRAASKSEKANMRSVATGAMMAAIDSIATGTDPVDAMATVTAIRTMMAAWTESNTRSNTVVDYSNLVSIRVATLRMAADMIESGTIVPNGVPDGTELTFDSTVDGDATVAARIAGDAVRRSEKSDMRSTIASIVPDMIENQFYSVADVANMVAGTDTYAGRTVSHGAVRNALESNKIPNVTFVPATSDNVNGCRKS